MKTVYGFEVDTIFNNDKSVVRRSMPLCATRELAEQALEAIKDCNDHAGYTDRTILYGEIKPLFDIYETMEEIPFFRSRK